MAIHDRMKQIAKELGAPGKPLSWAALAERTEGGATKQALAKIVKLSEDGHESGHKALANCASKWGYSYDWLMTGRGTPRAQPRDALELAIESEPWDPSAVAFARSLAEGGKQYPVAGWAKILRGAHELAVADNTVTPRAVKTAPPSR